MSVVKEFIVCPKSSKENEQIVWQAQNLTTEICDVYIYLFAIIITKLIKNESDESGKKHSYKCTMYRCWIEQFVRKRNTKASWMSLTATLTLNEMIKIKIGRITSIIITLTVLSFHQIFKKMDFPMLIHLNLYWRPS